MNKETRTGPDRSGQLSSYFKLVLPRKPQSSKSILRHCHGPWLWLLYSSVAAGLLCCFRLCLTFLSFTDEDYRHVYGLRFTEPLWAIAIIIAAKPNLFSVYT